MTGKVT